jgi:hypothetical protein
MKKDDNEWEILKCRYQYTVNINTIDYLVSDDTACLANAILLLVDAINDKKI